MNDELLKIDNQLCFRLYAASRNMTRLYQPFLENYSLTYPQYIVLLVIFEKRSIDFRELSEIVELKTGTLTPIVNRIIELGYIKKELNEKDHRKFFVTLTEKGVQLNKDIIDVPEGLGAKLDISLESYMSLVKELDQLLDKMRNIENPKGENK